MKQIIEDYKHGIKKIIKNITGKPNEDIEQEVYIKTWVNIGKYSEKGKFKNWISTITTNICRDYLKSSSFKNSSLCQGEERLMSIEDYKINPEHLLLSKQRQKTILDAINKLNSKYKQVVILYEIKELSYEEISEIIKVPIGTVKSRLYNARKELSIKLKDLI